MIPLPPTGSRTDSRVVGERTNEEGHVEARITEKRHYIHGKWLLHPTLTWGEWQGRVRNTYFLENEGKTNTVELRFLANNDYDGWQHFFAIPNGSYWWGYTPVHFQTNEMNSVAVFDSTHFKHIRDMQGYHAKMLMDGRTIGVRGTNGWWIYRISEDEFVPDPQHK
jgi:hypothetical protein